MKVGDKIRVMGMAEALNKSNKGEFEVERVLEDGKFHITTEKGDFPGSFSETTGYFVLTESQEDLFYEQV